MKVVFEATPVLPKPSGVGLYVLNMLTALAALQESEDFELDIAYHPSFKNWLKGHLSLPDALTDYPDTHIVPVPVRMLNLLNQVPGSPWIDDFETRFGNPDIYHGTNYAVYPCRRSLRVMNIYDLTFVRYPHYVTAIVRTYYQRVKHCLKWTDLVLTISESSKRDIVEYLSVPPERIWVTPLASRYAGEVKVMTSPHIAIKALKKPFILFVSTLEPRKNVVTLIRAFEQLKEELNIDHQLVLVGQKGWKFEPIFDAILASPWRDHILHLDYLSDEEVAYCYSYADVFAYPSHYEGFGMPVLEAMALGCPVVTSNASSLPEVAGEAALLVDPDNVDELAMALWKVISDYSLRQSLIERGRIRANDFSWINTAKATLEAYRSLL